MSQPKECNGAIEGADDIMSLTVALYQYQNKSCDISKQLPGSQECNGLTNGGAGRTGTSTGTKCQIIPLNNHVNMTNVMISLMAPLALCNIKHATHQPYMSISQSVDIRQLC